MKMTFKKNSGFAMISSLILTFIAFGYSLSYFDLLTSERRLVSSSEKMQQAEAIAEAGIEEAMWEYNYNSGSFSSWSVLGSTASKTSSGFSSLGDYTVSVDSYGASTPGITSTCTYTDSGVSKQVQIRCAMITEGIYNKAVKANGEIEINGTGELDSYDSSEGAYGTGDINSNADLATNGTDDPIITVGGNAVVNGNAATGTGGTVNESGAGDLTGSVLSGFNESLPENTPLPELLGAAESSSISSATAITVSGTQYYKCDAFDLGSGDTVTFSGTGTYYVYLTGDAHGDSLSITSSGRIVVETGVTLIIYAAGDVNMQGQGVVNNNSTTGTTNFQLYGTATCTDVTFGGGSDFVGIVNAPNAEMTLVGGNDFYGAVVADSFDMGGTGSFHYDENLSTFGSGTTKKLQWYSRA